MTVPVETLPIPADCSTALLYGGAFDPPHRAHLQLPPLARAAIAADLLLYIPAGAPPLKDGPIAAPADRIAMLSAGLADTSNTAIATLELDRAKANPAIPSYTIDTLRHIKSKHPRTTLRLLIGADQARQFHRWKDAREVIILAEPAVMLRPPMEDAAALLTEIAPHWTPAELAQWGGRLIELPAIQASSTRVRELLATNPASPELETLLTLPVRQYITENKLYDDQS